LDSPAPKAPVDCAVGVSLKRLPSIPSGEISGIKFETTEPETRPLERMFESEAAIGLGAIETTVCCDEAIVDENCAAGAGGVTIPDVTVSDGTGFNDAEVADGVTSSAEVTTGVVSFAPAATAGDVTSAAALTAVAVAPVTICTTGDKLGGGAAEVEAIPTIGALACAEFSGAGGGLAAAVVMTWPVIGDEVVASGDVVVLTAVHKVVDCCIGTEVAPLEPNIEICALDWAVGVAAGPAAAGGLEFTGCALSGLEGFPCHGSGNAETTSARTAPAFESANALEVETADDELFPMPSGATGPAPVDSPCPTWSLDEAATKFIAVNQPALDWTCEVLGGGVCGLVSNAADKATSGTETGGIVAAAFGPFVTGIVAAFESGLALDLPFPLVAGFEPKFSWFGFAPSFALRLVPFLEEVLSAAV